MTAGQLGGFLEVSKLSPGRRLWVLEQMKERAQARGLSDLVRAIEQAMNKEDVALELAFKWRVASENHAIHAPGAQQVDAQLDRALAGLYESLKLKVRAFDDERVGLAQGLLDRFFPQGVGVLTSLPYVEENAMVTTILACLAEPTHKAALAVLHLEDWVERITELNVRYGELLSRPEPLHYEDVKKAEQKAWSALCAIVARVLGAFPEDTPSDTAARDDLLKPLHAQEEEASLLRARRRAAAKTSPPLEPPAPPAAPHKDSVQVARLPSNPYPHPHSDADSEADAELLIPDARPCCLSGAPPTEITTKPTCGMRGMRGVRAHRAWRAPERGRAWRRCSARACIGVNPRLGFLGEPMMWMALIGAASAQTRGGLEQDPHYSQYVVAVEGLGLTTGTGVPEIMPGTCGIMEIPGHRTPGRVCALNPSNNPTQWTETQVMPSADAMDNLYLEDWVLVHETGLNPGNQAGLNDYLDDIEDTEDTTEYVKSTYTVTNKTPATGPQLAAPALGQVTPGTTIYLDLYAYRVKQGGSVVGWLLLEYRMLLAGPKRMEHWYLTDAFDMLDRTSGDIELEYMGEPGSIPTFVTNAKADLGLVPLTHVQKTELYSYVPF